MGTSMSSCVTWAELMRRNVVGVGTDQRFAFIYVTDVSLQAENTMFGFDPTLSEDQLLLLLEPKKRELSAGWLQTDWPPPEVQSELRPLAIALWRIRAALGISAGKQRKSPEEIEAGPFTVFSGLESCLRDAEAYRSLRASVAIDVGDSEAIRWGFGGLVRNGSVLPISKQSSWRCTRRGIVLSAAAPCRRKSGIKKEVLNSCPLSLPTFLQFLLCGRRLGDRRQRHSKNLTSVRDQSGRVVPPTGRARRVLSRLN